MTKVEENRRLLLKDFSDQIRSEIAEFYTINAAFAIVNSIFLGLIVEIIKKNIGLPLMVILVILFLLINSIWYFELILAIKWKRYWMERAKAMSKKLKIESIWDEKYYFSLLKIRANEFFYALPIIFSILIMTVTYHKYQNIFVAASIVAIWLLILILGSFSICQKTE